MDPVTRERLSATFDSAADSYPASRPGYPQDAVDWLLGGRAGDVLDLGAGSGALTRALAAAVTGRLVAAEPSSNLLLELRAAAPTASAVRAGAEQLPFADGSFDVVTVATAFHWFDASRAVAEISRVLRPGGHLSLVWNTRSVTFAWTRELDDLLRAAQPATLTEDWGTGSVRALDGSVDFEPREYAAFAHSQRLDRSGLLHLVASRSYVIALDEAPRRALLEAVGALFDDAGAPTDAGAARTVELPYRAQCWRAAVRRTTSA